MNVIRRYYRHVILGGVVGAASFKLWQYALAGAVPMWLLCIVAVAFVLVVEFLVAEARYRRGRPTRRRAHARPAPANPRKDTTPA
ncbi:hypothetical protein ACWC09_26525 [Streptomyces sp. NPDC001617]